MFATETLTRRRSSDWRFQLKTRTRNSLQQSRRTNQPLGKDRGEAERDEEGGLAKGQLDHRPSRRTRILTCFAWRPCRPFSPFVLIVIELSERCEYNILWSKSLRPTLAETGTSTPESHCLEIDQIPFADVSSIRIKAAQIKASMGQFTWKAPGLKSRPWRLCRRSSALSLSAQFGEPGNENLTICRTKTHLKWQRHNMLA